MKFCLKSVLNLMTGAVFVLVFSLTGIAVAAPAPVITVQAPLVNGIVTPLKSAVDANGDIYVADPRSGGVVVLDQYGVLKQRMGLPASARGLALINPNGNISGGKVLVGQETSVVVLDANGVEISRLGSGAVFGKVTSIAVDGSGNIYVADAGTLTIKKFSSAGGFIKEFGSGLFFQPVSLAVAAMPSGDQIAVVDIIKSNVQFFDTNGNYLKTIGTKGTFASLVFNYPVAVTFEYKGGVLSRMYVLDLFEGRFQAIDPINPTVQGTTLLGNYGTDATSLLTPVDIVFDQVNSRLLVANGNSNLVSYGIDGGGNPVNLTPPTLTIAQSAMTVNQPSVVLNGTTDAGCSITAAANTTAKAGVASFPSSTSWMLSVNNLVVGANTISISARNQFGATITKSVLVTYQPPANSLTVNAYPTLTSQAAIQLSGTTDAGSSVAVTNAATGITGNASVIGNQWYITLTLVEGPNSISFGASKAGTATAHQDISIALDTKAPALVVSLPANGSSTANQVLGLSGMASDQSSFNVTVNGDTVPVTNGQFNTSVVLKIGANVVRVMAVDAVSNQSEITRTINFAPDFPVITVRSPADGAITNKQDVTVDGSVNGGVTVKVNSVSAAVDAITGAWSAPVKLSAGLNTIEIMATDVYGQTAVVQRTITYDGVAPQVTITSPSQNIAVNNPGLTISGKVVDTAGIASITATVNGVSQAVQVSGDTFSLFAEFIAERAYTIAITVTDTAGNSTTALRTVVYDVTAPLLKVGTVSQSSTKVSGTVELGATVEVRDATGKTAKVTINGTDWVADLSGGSYDLNTLTAYAVDAAGNTSVAKISFQSRPNYVYTIKDALLVLNLVVSGKTPTEQQLNFYDVGPLLNGNRNPDGRLDIIDAILILRSALGLTSWK